MTGHFKTPHHPQNEAEIKRRMKIGFRMVLASVIVMAIGTGFAWRYCAGPAMPQLPAGVVADKRILIYESRFGSWVSYRVSIRRPDGKIEEARVTPEMYKSAKIGATYRPPAK